MEIEQKLSTIAIKPETKARLDKVGDKGDTYEDIIKRLLDQYKAQ
jgi:hypothetical protein